MEESPQALLGPIQANPEKPPGPGVDLVDQRQVAMPPLPLDLVDTQRLDPLKRAAPQTPLDGELHRAVDRFPGGMERRCYLKPRQPLGPPGQEPAVGRGQLTLAVAP